MNDQMESEYGPSYHGEDRRYDTDETMVRRGEGLPEAVRESADPQARLEASLPDSVIALSSIGDNPIYLKMGDPEGQVRSFPALFGGD